MGRCAELVAFYQIPDLRLRCKIVLDVRVRSSYIMWVVVALEIDGRHLKSTSNEILNNDNNDGNNNDNDDK